MYFIKPTLLLLLIFFCHLLNAQIFKVHFTPSSSNESFSGNVFLYLSKDNKNPKDGKVGRIQFPCFRIAVLNIKPGATVTFDDAAVSFPVALSDIERGDYYVQAVWDKNLGGRTIANSPGNMYSHPVKVLLTKNHNELFNIVCDEVVREKTFIETEFRKEVKQHSALLSRFHKKNVTIDAAILLPKEYYEQPERKFPVVYTLLGFGGDYYSSSGVNRPSVPMDTTPAIKVFLDGQCPQGHSEYANSENNGPWGDALVTELIPAIEKKFRCNKARLLTGHSSGGWASLWLQVNYPEVFIAAFSRSPDAVDFRNFSQVNLYSDKSMFYKKDSSLRMGATVAGYMPWASMKLSYGLENVILRGEQMHSFNAVFSQRDADGNPRKLCDPVTGIIDSVTVNHWKAYDISLLLQTNWHLFQPHLQNKIFVTVGKEDNFFLHESVKLFEEEMKKLNTGFVFKYYTGDHFTVASPDFLQEGNKFLQEKYNEFMKNENYRLNYK
jgi:S-formylglutathione hydrolase FrmB